MQEAQGAGPVFGAGGAGGRDDEASADLGGDYGQGVRGGGRPAAAAAAAALHHRPEQEAAGGGRRRRSAPARQRRPPARQPGQDKPFRDEIYTDTEIQVPAGRVWYVLIDLAAYPEWNPLRQPVGGEPKVRRRLRFQVRSRSGLECGPTEGSVQGRSYSGAVLARATSVLWSVPRRAVPSSNRWQRTGCASSNGISSHVPCKSVAGSSCGPRVESGGGEALGERHEPTIVWRLLSRLRSTSSLMVQRAWFHTTSCTNPGNNNLVPPHRTRPAKPLPLL